jgi:hypothetical protein
VCVCVCVCVCVRERERERERDCHLASSAMGEGAQGCLVAFLPRSSVGPGSGKSKQDVSGWQGSCEAWGTRLGWQCRLMTRSCKRAHSRYVSPTRVGVLSCCPCPLMLSLPPLAEVPGQWPLFGLSSGNFGWFWCIRCSQAAGNVLGALLRTLGGVKCGRGG